MKNDLALRSHNRRKIGEAEKASISPYRTQRPRRRTPGAWRRSPGKLPDAPRLGGAPGRPGLFLIRGHSPACPRLAAKGANGEEKPGPAPEAGVETLSTQPPPSSPWRPQRQARQRAKHPADAARRAEGRRCWRQDQPRGHDRLVRRREGRNSKPRDYPGSLPLEAALRNCRRILRQASERRDPGMTGTLGDCPAGRSQAALAA